MNPPRWFVQDLRLIDPTYFPAWNDDYHYWEIKKKLEVYRKDKDNGKAVFLKDPTVAVFETLDMRAVHRLRSRKLVGLKYAGTKKYLKDIERQNREAQAKGRELARDRIAREFMDAYKISKRKMFYGANS